MEGYAIALRQEDAASIAKLANTYGKYNQLDKNDERDNGLLAVPHIIFVFDVSSQGFQPIDNVYKVIDKLNAELSGRYERIVEDAEAVEIANEPEKKPAHGDSAAISQ